MTDWYRHRIVKHRVLPHVRFKEDPRVTQAEKDLLAQARADLSVYLQTHHPGQILETTFVHQRQDGLQVFVAITLFGPPELEREILEELAKKGEI